MKPHDFGHVGRYKFPVGLQVSASTAACFPGTCIEKTESGEFGGDGKHRREESKGTSETEVPGQHV